MVRLNFSAIIIKVIMFFLVIKVNSKRRPELLTWTEDHFIKELSNEDIPENCQKIGICSHIPIYDYTFFDKLLRRVLQNHNKFNVDQVMVPNLPNTEEIEELCVSKEEIIWPQAAKDERGQWQYILNTNATRFQAYRIHRCIEIDSSCSKAAIFKGFDNSCYQDTSLRKMVYIDVKNRKLATTYFQVPNCCSCKIIKKD